ncbi:MAG TPA: Xaa-Pro peptidase family protein [Anaerolineales bacterium]|nr:Xaa-Pro peptidase family protein [Anaerolineales bacterium]
MITPHATTVFTSRHSRLLAELEDQRQEALVINAGASLVYFTGLHFHLSERPVLAILVQNRPVILVVPEMEAGKTAQLPFANIVFPYSEDPATWPGAFQQAAQAAGFDRPRRVGIEPRQLRVLELRLLEAAAPLAEFLPAETSVAALRMHKDAGEISAMRKAVDVAQQALLATLPLVKAGMTERELAAELTLQMLRHGSNPEMPFYPIVAAGPNSANPHAVPGDRPLAHGDLLILDWGATVNGYLSDLTRTFSIGQPDQEMARLGQIVLEANAAARTQAAPGVQASQIDRAARDVIEKAGYGAHFLHRTGHGLGLEGHEEPYIRADNPLSLAPGMTFTIEPGIYLAGRGGVRIEDDMVITEDGAESLSDLPRELIALDD